MSELREALLGYRERQDVRTWSRVERNVRPFLYHVVRPWRGRVPFQVLSDIVDDVMINVDGHARAYTFRCRSCGAVFESSEGLGGHEASEHGVVLGPVKSVDQVVMLKAKFEILDRLKVVARVARVVSHHDVAEVMARGACYVDDRTEVMLDLLRMLERSGVSLRRVVSEDVDGDHRTRGTLRRTVRRRVGGWTWA